MGASDMSIYRVLKIFQIVLYVVCIYGCDRHDHGALTGFTHTVPTVFKNRNGATIKVSTEGLWLGGVFYKAHDCSNENFNCFVYGGKILFITPKLCYMPPKRSWRVGSFMVEWNGYDQGSEGDVIQSNFGNGVGYGFSELKGKGIDSIAYNIGDPHVTVGERFYADAPSWRMNDMLYFSPSGPAFLPCVKEWGK